MYGLIPSDKKDLIISPFPIRTGSAGTQGARLVIGTTYTPSSRRYAAFEIPQMTQRTFGAFPACLTLTEDRTDVENGG